MTEAEQKLLDTLRGMKAQAQATDGTFGKIGDGTLLKLLLEHLPQILQIVMLFLDEKPEDEPQTT